MNSRNFVRAVVLRTNPYRPFSSLNRIPYKLAIEAFCRLCRKFPEITSAYVRGSLVGLDWVPALSDIDLTVIIDDRLAVYEEYSFLRSFWKAHDRLKRIFPMLGEIEVFNRVELSIITKFGILGYRSFAWQKIYGDEVRHFDARMDSTRRYIDPISYALQFYLGPFLREIAKANGASYLAAADLRRLALKIVRTLDLIECRSEIEQIKSHVWDCGSLLEFVMGRLDECVNAFNQQRQQENAKQRIHNIQTANSVNFERLDLDHRSLEQAEKFVDGVIVNRREGFIVLRKETRVMGLGMFLVDMRELLGSENRDFAMVTQRTFEFILRYFNPFQYTDLVENRSVLWGRDVVLDVEPPNEFCFVNFLVKKVKNVLHFARNRDLVMAERREVFASTSLAWVMNIAPVIKLYLEKKILIPSYRSAWQEARRQYPEYENTRQELWERSSEMSLETLGWEWYRLLKTTGNDIQKSLTQH